tara:strand:- start:257 stop:1243 length:987 start_codon:yes stop_codon:yes gene_type:complete
MTKQRVLSGIQPTGNLHLGNYLGAIKNWVSAQYDYDNLFCIVDLHAITIPENAKGLNTRTRETAGILFAAGIDPNISSLFIQSQISAHCELAWILNCFIPMGWMKRMTQFKDKAGKERESASVGLFDYPALMAADILVYDADLVPVGEDQKQHLELTRDVAERFNNMYGETLKIPKPSIPSVGARIMSLDNPSQKMSKSDQGKNQAINLLDSPDEIRSKFRKATTDSNRLITFDKHRPGVFNLLTIYQALTGQTESRISADFDGKGYGDLKEAVAEVVISELKPLQKNYKDLTADHRTIDSLLQQSADRVKPIADQTVSRVKARLGLG